MDKQTLIDLGNELLQNKADLGKWMPIIAEHAEKFPKYKPEEVVQVFLKVPDQIKVGIMRYLLELYGKELNICTLSVEDKNSQIVVNGILQPQHKILYYF